MVGHIRERPTTSARGMIASNAGSRYAKTRFNHSVRVAVHFSWRLSALAMVAGSMNSG